MAKQSNILLGMSEVKFFDAYDSVYVNPTLPTNNDLCDIYVETTVDNVVNSLINHDDLKKTQVLQFVNEMLENEEFEGAIIQAVLKHAAQRTEGSAKTIMKAAKQAWDECTSNY